MSFHDDWISMSEQDIAEAETAEEESRRSRFDYPDGTYSGIISGYEPREVLFGDNPLFGKTVAHVALELNVNGATRREWVDAYPRIVKGPDNRVAMASLAGLRFIRALGGAGKPFDEVLDVGKHTPLLYTVKAKKNGKGKFVQDIKAIAEEAATT